MRGLCPSIDNMAREMNRINSDEEALTNLAELDKIMMGKLEQNLDQGLNRNFYFER